MFSKGKVELLIERTKTEFGVDIDNLKDGSHTKVYVRCTRCSEEFRREYRYLWQLHNCPTHRTIDGIRHKWCNKCKQFKNVELFHPNQARCDNLSSYCVTCLQDQGATKARVERLRLKRNIFDEWVKILLSRKRGECRKHGIPFNLDFLSLVNKWNAQGGRCYYSNVELKFNSKSLYGAQLDRVVPADGYVTDNVVWCSKAINNLKNNASLDELAQFLYNAYIDVPVRCEFLKLTEDAIIPTRKKATDAGFDVYSISDIVLPPNSVTLVKTGLALVVPDGYFYTIEGRSGFWMKGIMPCRGIIDATYSGEVQIAMHNLSQTAFPIAKGDRFAQFVMQRFVRADITSVEKIDDSYSDRGTAGFGSTGTK